jgi:hypothetical protein
MKENFNRNMLCINESNVRVDLRFDGMEEKPW